MTLIINYFIEHQAMSFKHFLLLKNLNKCKYVLLYYLHKSLLLFVVNVTSLIAKINFGFGKTCDLLSRHVLRIKFSVWMIEDGEKRKRKRKTRRHLC